MEFIFTILNFHTYANNYIHRFGSGLYPQEPDLITHREIGAELSKYNQYFFRGSGNNKSEDAYTSLKVCWR